MDKSKNIIHVLKVIFSFVLLGAITAGAIFGWINMQFDVRIIGAAIGGLLGIAIQLKS